MVKPMLYCIKFPFEAFENKRTDIYKFIHSKGVTFQGETANPRWSNRYSEIWVYVKPDDWVELVVSGDIQWVNPIRDYLKTIGEYDDTMTGRIRWRMPIKPDPNMPEVWLEKKRVERAKEFQVVFETGLRGNKSEAEGRPSYWDSKESRRLQKKHGQPEMLLKPSVDISQITIPKLKKKVE